MSTLAKEKRLQPHPESNSLHYYDRKRQMMFITDPESDSPEFAFQDITNIPHTDKDIFYEVEMGYTRVDLISLRFYSTPRLWWLISLANNVKPWEQIPPGTVIRIPNLTELDSRGFFQNPAVKEALNKREWE